MSLDSSSALNRISPVPGVGPVVSSIALLINLVRLIRDTCLHIFYSIKHDRLSGTIESLKGRISIEEAQKLVSSDYKMQKEMLVERRDLEISSADRQVKLAESALNATQHFAENFIRDLKAGNIVNIFQNEEFSSSDLAFAKNIISYLDDQIEILKKERMQEHNQGPKVQEHYDNAILKTMLFRAKMSQDFADGMVSQISDLQKRLSQTDQEIANHIETYGENPTDPQAWKERQNLYEKQREASNDKSSFVNFKTLCEEYAKGFDLINVDLQNDSIGQGLATGIENNIKEEREKCKKTLNQAKEDKILIFNSYEAQLNALSTKREKREAELNEEYQKQPDLLEPAKENFAFERDNLEEDIHGHRNELIVSLIRLSPLVSLAWNIKYDTHAHRYQKIPLSPETKK